MRWGEVSSREFGENPGPEFEPGGNSSNVNGNPSLSSQPDDLDLLAQRDWIVRLARRLATDSGLAEDAAQETLLDALRNGWLGRQVSRGFVGGVVRNKVLQEQRAATRRRAREAVASRPEAESARAELVDQAEAHRNLVTHVLALGDPHRAVLLERYFEGLSPAQIAQREGARVETIHRRLSRAHAALRQRLERDGGEAGWVGALVPFLPDARFGASAALFSAALMKVLASVVVLATLALVLRFALGSSGEEPGPEALATTPEVELAAPSEPALPPIADAELSRSSRRPASPAAAAPLADAALSVTVEVEVERSDAPQAKVEAPLALPSDFGITVERRDGPRLVETPAPTLVEMAFEVHVVRGETTLGVAALDADGSARLGDLSAEDDVEVHLRRGEQIWIVEPALRLAPGETTELNWTVQLTGVVAGIALDASEQPVAGEELRLITRRFHARQVGRNLPSDRVVAVCSTGPDGRFEFGGVPPGQYLVGPTGGEWIESTMEDGTLRLDQATNPAAPHYELVVLEPNELRVETTVRVWRGLTVRGKLRFPNGDPAPDVLLLALPQGVGGSYRADSYGDGAFDFGAMAPGVYTIIDNNGPDGWGLFSRPELEAGSTDVELVLEPAGMISGTVSDSATGDLYDGWLNFTQDEHGPRPGSGVSIGTSDGGDGEFRVNSLEPGSYTLRYASTDGRWYGYTGDVQISGGHELQSVHVEVEPAAQLRLEAPKDDANVRAYLYLGDGSLFGYRPISLMGTTVVPVPPGTVEVRFRQRGSEVLQSLTLEMVVGEEQVAAYVPPDPTGE